MISHLERRTLREQVLDQITHEILTGVLPPGTHLSEVALAEGFEVSRGTIREALRSLQQAQLVEDAPRGLQVKAMSVREIKELYATRGALECLAITTIMSSANAQEIIDTLFETLPPQEPQVKTFAKMLAADLSFHQKLVESSENRVLIHLWHGLQNQMKVAILSDTESQIKTLMTRDHHIPILEAMQSGDQTKTVQLVTEHMNTAAKLLTSSFPS